MNARRSGSVAVLLPILALALALGSLSCRGGSTETLEGRDRLIEVLEPGLEPRLLEYRPASGVRHPEIAFRMGQVDAPVQGFGSTLAASWTRPAALADPFRMTIERVEITGGGGAIPSSAEDIAFKSIRLGFGAFEGELRASSSSELKFARTKGVATRPSFVWLLYLLCPPLPPEPIGVGGRWRVAETISLSGRTEKNTRTYEVTARDGQRVTLKVTGSGETSDGTASHKVDGTLVVDLVDPLPATAALAVVERISMSGPKEAEPFTFEVLMSIEVRDGVAAKP